VKEFYVTSAWDAMFGRRQVVVYDYCPINSDIKVIGPIKAMDKSHARRKFNRFIKTGSIE